VIVSSHFNKNLLIVIFLLSFVRNEVEYLYRPQKPVAIGSLKLTSTGEDFSRLLTLKDKEEMEEVWREVQDKSPKSFSKPKGLATLSSVKGGEILYDFTEFKEYVSVSRTSDRRNLSEKAYDNMRVLAVGATLEMSDGSIFVHRRPYESTHVAGLIDSSCAGLCLTENEIVNPEKSITFKLERELKVSSKEVQILGVNGIHSSGNPDFSGLIDISLKTKLTPEELTERIRDTFPEYWFVPKKDLGDFVFERYAARNDMVGDGAMILLSSLGNKEFYRVIKDLKKARKKIEFGALERGVFVENGI
jgi:hypothetical protein